MKGLRGNWGKLVHFGSFLIHTHVKVTQISQMTQIQTCSGKGKAKSVGEIRTGKALKLVKKGGDVRFLFYLCSFNDDSR